MSMWSFFMGKKHYFLNSIYLFICISFVILASFLNLHNSSAEQNVGFLNGDFHLEDQEEQKDIASEDFSLRQKIENKYESSIAASYETAYPSPVISSAAVNSAPQSIPYSSYIAIAGRTLRVEDVNSTLVDSTDHVNRWGKKFLYGHNTSTVFGPIRNLTNGATFVAKIDGEEHVYQVMYTETMEKPKVEKNMLAIAYAIYGGNYDLSLMTCAGASLGGGDATHRFVLFANRIS